MKTIYYLAISIPKSMASISSGEKCCSLKLPGSGQAGKWVLGRLKACDGEPSPCPGVLPALCCLPEGRAGAPVSPSRACLVTARQAFGMALSSLEPLWGLPLVPPGQVGHALHFLQKKGSRLCSSSCSPPKPVLPRMSACSRNTWAWLNTNPPRVWNRRGRLCGALSCQLHHSKKD